MQNFEPFLDWEGIDQEIASQIHKLVRINRRAAEAFSEAKKGDENFVMLARAFMKSWHNLATASTIVLKDIYTVPVMVHVAGERNLETNPEDEDQEGIVQRCSRCGSILNIFQEGQIMMDPETGPREMQEDDMPWFDKGTIVAKSSTSTQPFMNMYTLENGQRLQKHEKECVALNDLVAP